MFAKDATNDIRRGANVIFQDSIYLTNYTVIKSGINHHYFLLPDSNYTPKRGKNKFWKDKDVFLLVTDELQYLNIASEYCKYCNGELSADLLSEIWPWGTSNFIFWAEYSNKDIICTCDKKRPSFFCVF